MNPEAPYNLATSAIDDFAQSVNDHYARVAEITTDEGLSATRKAEMLEETRSKFEASLPEVGRKVNEKLTRAEQLASAALSGSPTDAALEQRKQRAGARVVRLLDAGKSPSEIAELLASTGDVDGYRALRDEIPAWVTAQVPAGRASEKTAHIAQHLLAVDQAMVPALTGDLARAARVRLGVDEQRARLTAAQQYAIKPNPMTRLARGYARV